MNSDVTGFSLSESRGGGLQQEDVVHGQLCWRDVFAFVSPAALNNPNGASEGNQETPKAARKQKIPEGELLLQVSLRSLKAAAAHANPKVFRHFLWIGFQCLLSAWKCVLCENNLDLFLLKGKLSRKPLLFSFLTITGHNSCSMTTLTCLMFKVTDLGKPGRPWL